MKKSICILILLASSTLASFGQDVNVSKLDRFLNILASKDMAMGSLAISKDGIIKYQKAIGYSSLIDSRKIKDWKALHP